MELVGFDRKPGGGIESSMEGKCQGHVIEAIVACSRPARLARNGDDGDPLDVAAGTALIANARASAGDLCTVRAAAGTMIGSLGAAVEDRVGRSPPRGAQEGHQEEE
jgi:hypothetical protein